MTESLSLRQAECLYNPRCVSGLGQSTSAQCKATKLEQLQAAPAMCQHQEMLTEPPAEAKQSLPSVVASEAKQSKKYSIDHFFYPLPISTQSQP
jgi:hypothetical protein